MTVQLILSAIYAALYVPLCALAWRFRGGGIIPTGSTQFARIACATVLAVPLALLFANWWLLLLIPTIFAGLASVGWGDFADMGHTAPKSEELVSPLVRWIGPERTIHDVAGMSLTGLVLVLPSAALLFVLGAAWWVLAVPGLLMGPLYFVSWKVFDQPTATAEWIVGGLLGGALYLALAL